MFPESKVTEIYCMADDFMLFLYVLSFMLYPLSKCRYFNHLLMIWDLILFDKFQA